MRIAEGASGPRRNRVLRVELPAWKQTQPTSDLATTWRCRRHRDAARHRRWRSPNSSKRVRRILIVTDAWQPAGQRRGAHAWSASRKTCRRFGAEAVFLTPGGLPQRADADLSRHQAGADHAVGDPPAHRGGRRRPCPHRHRRPARAAGAARTACKQASRSRPATTRKYPGISERAACRSRRAGPMPGCAASTIPRRRRWWRRRRSPPTSPQRASPSSGHGRAASTPSFSIRRIAAISACRGRCSSMSAASRSRRTCAPSSTSTCRAAR